MDAMNDWMQLASDFLERHRAASAALVAISVASFVVGVIATPRLLARLPHDYFSRRHAPLESLRATHPALRAAILLLKNGLGVTLLIAGLLMLVLPGQGLLTILVALTLLDLPGKQRLLAWLVGRRPLFNAINWVRERSGARPLDAVPKSHPDAAADG